MKQFRIFSIFTFLGLGLISCSSSDNDPYWPDPNKGDYVKVSSMTVSSSSSKNNVVDVKYSIEYNSFLKARFIKRYENVDLSKPMPNQAPLLYSFNYLEKHGLNTIEIKQNEETVIDKLTAVYKNDVLEKLESKIGFTTFEYSGGNIVKAIKDDKSYIYGYDNRGNLTSVSDESGKLFSYEYGNGNNPFVHSEFNLTFDYIPGGDLIRFVQGTKNAMTVAINEKTGEKYSFTYQLDEFNYPTEMVVKGKESDLLFKFENSIIRKR
ncbi:MAG: hypothetical protein ACRCVU_10145, partial [Flavobacterium sp.]